MQLHPDADTLVSITIFDAVRPPVARCKQLASVEHHLWRYSECRQDFVGIVTELLTQLMYLAFFIHDVMWLRFREDCIASVLRIYTADPLSLPGPTMNSNCGR